MTTSPSIPADRLAAYRTIRSPDRELVWTGDGNVDLRLAEVEASLDVALAENTRLLARVAQSGSQTAKNSTNFSMPPSRDDVTARAERAKRASQSLKTGREPGWQRGRRRNTLKRVDDPDHIVGTDRACGACLLGAAACSKAKRCQVFDVVEHHVEVTEHRAVTCR